MSCPPLYFYFFIHSKVGHTAEAVMRFKIENIEHTPRQIQHNEFLIRISKDPLKPNLRSVAVGVLFVLESMHWQMLFDKITAFRPRCCGSFKSPYIFHKDWAFGHFSSYRL